jgi:hypothetical protein
VSKTVFAYEILKLCEKGVMNLDTPLTKYTPDRFLKGDLRLDLITARHVLSHKTGFPNWRSDKGGDRNVPLTAADFRAWREQLQTMENLGAVALVQRNLAVNGNVEPIDVAQMTASGFRLARVPAQLGRTLVEGDEAPGAPPVAVIGHRCLPAATSQLRTLHRVERSRSSTRRLSTASCAAAAQ